jgi:hypothetical protein
MQRALSWDGIIPQRYRDWQPFSAEDIRKIRDSIVQQRTGDRPFEIISRRSDRDWSSSCLPVRRSRRDMVG